MFSCFHQFLCKGSGRGARKISSRNDLPVTNEEGTSTSSSPPTKRARTSHSSPARSEPAIIRPLKSAALKALGMGRPRIPIPPRASSLRLAQKPASVERKRQEAPVDDDDKEEESERRIAATQKKDANARNPRAVRSPPGPASVKRKRQEASVGDERKNESEQRIAAARSKDVNASSSKVTRSPAGPASVKKKRQEAMDKKSERENAAQETDANLVSETTDYRCEFILFYSVSRVRELE